MKNVYAELNCLILSSIKVVTDYYGNAIDNQYCKFDTCWKKDKYTLTDLGLDKQPNGNFRIVNDIAQSRYQWHIIERLFDVVSYVQDKMFISNKGE